MEITEVGESRREAQKIDFVNGFTVQTDDLGSAQVMGAGDGLQIFTVVTNGKLFHRSTWG